MQQHTYHEFVKRKSVTFSNISYNRSTVFQLLKNKRLDYVYNDKMQTSFHNYPVILKIRI